jgi:hypothetical protein
MASQPIWTEDETPEAAPSFCLESDLEFYARRAMEEAHAGRRAACPEAASAHMYLAAAYSAQVAKEMARAAELEGLALAIARSQAGEARDG